MTNLLKITAAVLFLTVFFLGPLVVCLAVFGPIGGVIVAIIVYSVFY